jgi:hypothetical protein
MSLSVQRLWPPFAFFVSSWIIVRNGRGQISFTIPKLNNGRRKAQITNIHLKVLERWMLYVLLGCSQEMPCLTVKAAPKVGQRTDKCNGWEARIEPTRREKFSAIVNRTMIQMQVRGYTTHREAN